MLIHRRALRCSLAATVLLSLCAGPGRAADSCAAGDGSCSASDEPPLEFKCVKWRQTGSCSPKGPREKQGDRRCDAEIPTGTSGYCECAPAGDGPGMREAPRLRGREVTCDHRPLRCSTVCLEALRYTCVGWRNTGSCSADGERLQDGDRGCEVQIDPRMSGFCECGGGRSVRKPGCDHGDFEEPFTCRDVCAAEADLYEELGLDVSATEKEIKQTFRKLSLKYHPDKTRSDPVLTARFSDIRQAYDIIGEPAQRALYDVAGLKMVYEAAKVEKGPDSKHEVQVSMATMYSGGEVPQAAHRKVICRGCEGRSTPRCRRCGAECAMEIELVNVRQGPFVMQQKRQVKSKQRCRVQRTPLTVTVEPGTMPGDSVVFKNMGEQQPNKLPGDVTVTIKEKKHPVFKRMGVDLHAEVEVNLQEALLGFERTLTHLDGRQLHLSFDGVTKPFAIMKVTGEGMPHRSDPSERGDLFVKCKVVMPENGRTWLREMAALPPAAG